MADLHQITSKHYKSHFETAIPEPILTQKHLQPPQNERSVYKKKTKLNCALQLRAWLTTQ